MSDQPNIDEESTTYKGLYICKLLETCQKVPKSDKHLGKSPHAVLLPLICAGSLRRTLDLIL